LTVWDTATGKLLRKRRQPDPELNVLAYSPDGSRIATGQQKQIVKIYDAATLDRTLAFKNPEKEAHFGVDDYGTSALAYSPDGKLLLAGSQNGLIWLLDSGEENRSRILREVGDFDVARPNDWPFAPVVAALFSSDGHHAYAVQSSGMVWTWNTPDWTSGGKYQTEPGATSSALSPNGEVIAIANEDGAIRFYSAQSGELKLVVASTADANSALVVAPDGRYDFGIDSDLSLAAYRVGRKSVRVDHLPGNRRVPGLLGQFLKNNNVLSTEKSVGAGSHGAPLP
jgi:WD40 repeat protein